MTGRCFSLTCLPLRQPRRISNLFQFPGDAARVAAFLPDRRETCGGVRHPTGGRCRIFFARENLSLTNRLQPASDPVREGAKSDPGVGLLHSLRMEKTNDRVVAPAYVNERR